MATPLPSERARPLYRRGPRAPHRLSYETIVQEPNAQLIFQQSHWNGLSVLAVPPAFSHLSMVPRPLRHLPRYIPEAVHADPVLRRPSGIRARTKALRNKCTTPQPKNAQSITRGGSERVMTFRSPTLPQSATSCTA